MKLFELKQLIKECLKEQSNDLMANVSGSEIENISFSVDNKKVSIKLVNSVLIEFTSETSIKAVNKGPVNEMDNATVSSMYEEGRFTDEEFIKQQLGK